MRTQMDEMSIGNVQRYAGDLHKDEAAGIPDVPMVDVVLLLESIYMMDTWKLSVLSL
jgi:biopolymer transport protein ExbD